MSVNTFSETDNNDTYSNMYSNNSNYSMTNELDSLIQILHHKIETKDSSIKCVKYPNLLMASLIELNQLVGMPKLKDSIALQVMRLIDGANNGERSSKMLNTILYGPPGVGKTKVGIILAKIWFALGYLSKSANNHNTNTKKKNDGPNVTTTTINTSGNTNDGSLVFLVLLIFFYLITYIISGISYVYNSIGGLWLLGIVFFILIIIFYFYWNRKSYTTYITNIVKTSQENNIVVNDKNINSVNDRDIITVVSREDFVAGFLGQTAIKTKALLQANLGKVIFIDEAYSLLNGDRDQYGMEALTAINLFMSENPDSIAIIFAGYEDLMKYGIFKAQPGLPRRCMWHFKCQGYNGDQLCDIFLRQVYKDGWKILKTDYPRIRRLINDNKDLFPSFGGDTERLVFFSQLEASRTNMMSNSASLMSYSVQISDISSDGNNSSNNNSNNSNNSDTNFNSNDGKNKNKQNKILLYEHVQYGLRRLEENNIES